MALILSIITGLGIYGLCFYNKMIGLILGAVISMFMLPACLKRMNVSSSGRELKKQLPYTLVIIAAPLLGYLVGDKGNTELVKDYWVYLYGLVSIIPAYEIYTIFRKAG